MKLISAVILDLYTHIANVYYTYIHISLFSLLFCLFSLVRAPLKSNQWIRLKLHFKTQSFSKTFFIHFER